MIALSDDVLEMNRDINPYEAPNHVSASVGIKRFLGRSMVAGLLSVTTLSTGGFLYWLSSSEAIDLGRFGVVALVLIVFSALALLAASRFYSVGWRRYAIVFLIMAGICFLPIILIAFHEAGFFSLF